MTELIQGFNAALSVIASLLYSICYMIGGRDVHFLGIRARLWKRLIAPLLLASSAVAFSILAHCLNWAMLACIIWFIPWGYGADDIVRKVVRRTVQSIFFTAPAIIFGIFGGNLPVAILQAVIGIILTVFLGVKNPTSASEEEFLIAFSNTFLMGMILLG